MLALPSFLALIGLMMLGFALLALTQDQHRRAVGEPLLSSPARLVQRTAGYSLITLTLPLALWRDGPDFGALLWAVLLSLTAAAVTFMLSWRAHWLKPLARGLGRGPAPPSGPRKEAAAKQPSAESPTP